MLNVNHCNVVKNAKMQSSNMNNDFIKKVMSEKRFLNALNAKELAQSQENVRVVEEQRISDISEGLRKELDHEFLERKRRQQLREGNEELRQLQRQLGFALSFKQLTEQTKTLEAKKQQNMIDKRKEDHELHQKWAEYEEELKQKEYNESLRKTEHRNILLEQIKIIQKNRIKSPEDLEKDRERLKKVLEKLNAVEAEEKARDFQLKKETRMALDNFLQFKQSMQFKEKEKDNEDLMRANAVVEARERQKEELLAEKKRLMKERENLSMRIGLQIQKDREEKLKRENLLEDLLIQEKKALADEKQRKDLLGQAMYHQSLQVELQDELKALHLRKQLEKSSSDASRRESDRELAEKLKKERILEMEKKEKQTKEVRLALIETIELKRMENKIQFAKNKQYEEERLKNENKRQQAINEERMHLLQQQPKEILRFMPPGVLSQAERELLGLAKEA